MNLLNIKEDNKASQMDMSNNQNNMENSNNNFYQSMTNFMKKENINLSGNGKI